MKKNSILIIMMITILFTGCAKTKNDELFHEGKLALEKHEYTKAQELLSQVLSADSNNEHARSMYMQAVKMKDALEYENKHLYDKAIQSLEYVERLKGGSSDIKSEATEKRKELTKLNDEYKQAQEERKENAKDVSKQDQNKLEQQALKENQKQEEEKQEEQENQQPENTGQNDTQLNDNEQNNQGSTTQENQGGTTQTPNTQPGNIETTNQPQQEAQI